MAGGFGGVFLVGVFAAVTIMCAALIPRLYRAGRGQAARGTQAARPGGDKPEPGGR